MNNNIVSSVSNPIVDESGHVYNSLRSLSKHLGISRNCISHALKKKGYFNFDDHTYILCNQHVTQVPADGTCVTEQIDTTPMVTTIPRGDEAEYEEYLKAKEVKELPFEIYKFDPIEHKRGYRYAVALFSDLHVEETVTPESVNYLNEYNLNIAEQRVKKYFANLATCLIRDDVDELIFACLGDLISGYIHDELAQGNELTPLEATYKAQCLLYSGLEYLCKLPELKNLKRIRFIGIVGNHSRTTKKIQHANGYKMSYEWLMYQNVKNQCDLTHLPVEFYIPESELAVVKTPDEKTFIFCHGFQIKSSGSGTVCGIYPALNRLAMKWGKTFKQDKIYLGHFHTCVSIPNATVNGSVIGYNAFAMTNGLEYEEPAQQYEVYDASLGQLLSRKIYCR